MSHNTDTDNVKVLGKSNISTDNDSDRYKKSKQVEMIAQSLVDKLHTPDWFPFYCKVAYALPEATIWRLYEQATSEQARKKPGHNAARLFYWLCDRAMR